MATDNKNELTEKLSSGKLLSAANLESLIDLTVNNPDDIIINVRSSQADVLTLVKNNGQEINLNLPKIDADDVNTKDVLSKISNNTSNSNFDLLDFYNYNGDKVLTMKVPKTNLSNQIDKSKILSDISSQDESNNNIYTLKNYNGDESGTIVVPKINESTEEELDTNKIINKVVTTEDENNYYYSILNYNDKEIFKITANKPYKDGPYYYISDVLGFSPDFKGQKLSSDYNLQNLKIQGTIKPGTDDNPVHTIGIYDSNSYNNFTCALSIGSKSVNIDAILSMLGQDKYNLERLSKLTLISKDNDKTNTTVQLLTKNTDEIAHNGIWTLRFILGKHKSFDPDKGTQKNVIPYGTTNFKLVPNVKGQNISEIFNIPNPDIKDKLFYNDYFLGQKFITQIGSDGKVIGYNLKVKISADDKDKTILNVKIDNNTYSGVDNSIAHFYDLNIIEDAIDIKLVRVGGVKNDS